MANETKLETLRKLAYRISVTPDGDPEKENAINLLNKLKEKYGFSDKDVNTLIRTLHVFPVHESERQLMIQVICCTLPVHLNGSDEYEFCSYKIHHKRHRRKNDIYEFHIKLTTDEYKLIYTKFDAIKTIYQRKMEEYRVKLAKEFENRLAAFRSAFYRSSGLMNYALDEKEDDNQSDKAPEWSLSDLMRASEFLDDTVFPNSMISNDKVAIG